MRSAPACRRGGAYAGLATVCSGSVRVGRLLPDFAELADTGLHLIADRFDGGIAFREARFGALGRRAYHPVHPEQTEQAGAQPRQRQAAEQGESQPELAHRTLRNRSWRLAICGMRTL